MGTILVFSDTPVIPPVAPYTGGKVGLESGADISAGQSPAIELTGLFL